MRKILVGIILFSSLNVVASEMVPYSIQSIKSTGSEFIELVGSGFITINGKVSPYNNATFIAVKNIDNLTKVSGVENGCVISYSTNHYAESISVLNQSCTDILEEISKAMRK